VQVTIKIEKTHLLHKSQVFVFVILGFSVTPDAGFSKGSGKKGFL
jgi:hypothetical protein